MAKIQKTEEIRDIPPPLSALRDELKRESLYLEEALENVKESSPLSEARGISAVNRAFRNALDLAFEDDPSKAARLLEEMQVRAAEVERCYLVTHGSKAKKSLKISLKLSEWGREHLHDVKEGHSRKKAA